MSNVLIELKEKASHLTEAERAEFALSLLESLDDPADSGVEEASAFYESRIAGLGQSFAAEVQRTVTLIRQFPDTGFPVGPSRQRK